MKKLIIILLSIFILTSCNNEWKITTDDTSKKTWEENTSSTTWNEITNSSTWNELTNNPTWEEPTNDLIWQKTITYSDLKENLEKIKDIDLPPMEAEMLNYELKHIFTSNIKKESIDKNDIKICEKLNADEIEWCKTEFIYNKAMTSNNPSDCEAITDTWSINSCKNNIFLTQANKKSDISICDKIIDNSEEKFELNMCKNNILLEKARKDLDSNICNKITTDMEKQMCTDMIKMEKEMKDIEKKMENINE